MFSLNPMKELYESPLPPMALTDYEAFSKFLNQALHCCHETGRDFNVYLDWAIRALASSMAADSAARIFLPKTRTAPFSLDDLIPLSEIPSKGTVRVDLTKSYVVAPIWNNTDLVDLHLLSIHIDGLPGGHRNDTRCRSAAAERRTQCHAGEQQSHLLSSVVHSDIPLFSFGQ